MRVIRILIKLFVESFSTKCGDKIKRNWIEIQYNGLKLEDVLYKNEKRMEIKPLTKKRNYAPFTFVFLPNVY